MFASTHTVNAVYKRFDSGEATHDPIADGSGSHAPEVVHSQGSENFESVVLQ